MNRAEIITIGDELLIGQTVDTNSAWMGAELNMLGIRVDRITSISDTRNEIINSVDAALSRAGIVLITGGLGPTSDDITKEALSDYFGATMVMNDAVLAEVTQRLSRRSYPMNDNNRRQAMVPDKCTVLMNKTGTAPGMLFRKNESILVSMPGVPHEMKHIMREHVLPLLAAEFRGQAIVHKNIMTFGLPEGLLAEKLIPFEKELPGEIKLAYLPAQGIIKLRLTATGESPSRLSDLVKTQVRRLYELLPDVIYDEDEVTLEQTVGSLLLAKKLTLSTAESCTGGKIASLITSVAGSSRWYQGSVIAYDNAVKTSLLGVSAETLKSHGAVSEETAREMAAGALKVMGTDLAVSVTGIAGPDGGTPLKPVGTVFFAVADRTGIVTAKQVFGDDRNNNIGRAAYYALNMLRKQILR